MEGSKMSQTEYDPKAIMYSAYDIPNKLYNISRNLNIQQPRLPPNNAGRPNFNFGNKFSIFYLAKGEKRLDFRLSATCSMRKMVFDAKYRYVLVVHISSNLTLGITPH